VQIAEALVQVYSLDQFHQILPPFLFFLARFL